MNTTIFAVIASIVSSKNSGKYSTVLATANQHDLIKPSNLTRRSSNSKPLLRTNSTQSDDSGFMTSAMLTATKAYRKNFFYFFQHIYKYSRITRLDSGVSGGNSYETQAGKPHYL